MVGIFGITNCCCGGGSQTYPCAVEAHFDSNNITVDHIRPTTTSFYDEMCACWDRNYLPGHTSVHPFSERATGNLFVTCRFDPLQLCYAEGLIFPTGYYTYLLKTFETAYFFPGQTQVVVPDGFYLFRVYANIQFRTSFFGGTPGTRSNILTVYFQRDHLLTQSTSPTVITRVDNGWSLLVTHSNWDINPDDCTDVNRPLDNSDVSGEPIVDIIWTQT